MKYHDNQDARKGDTFTVGTFGTCRITELRDGLAIARNVSTSEVFELDALSDADLIERIDPFKSGPLPEWANTSAGIRAHGIKNNGDLINPYV